MFLLGIIIFVLFETFSTQSDLVVKTIYGTVEGIVDENVRKFLGVPFASPPVNELRWVEPRPKSPWFPNVLKTTSFGPGCPQECDTPPHTCPPVLSEDCLYLNVYTPRNVNLSQLQPVMVFIHGGHFDQGSAGVGLYDASTLVKASGLIFVTINYRLGVLGWLSSKQFSGNYGLLDQQLALEWVQDNIAFFGGDPNQVTLFGQSAGGCSIRAHLISPRSAGLFHRAIMQSDPLPLPMLGREDANSWANIFQTNTGCGDNLACLKKLNATFLIAIQKETEKHIRLERPIEVFFPITPVVDGNLIPYHWQEAVSTGQWNRVPLMIGTMSEDALLFVYKAVHSFLNSAEYSAVLGVIFHTQAFAVGNIYRPVLLGDNRPIMSTLGTDYIFTCSARKLLNLTQSLSPKPPVYLYQWNHALSFDAWGPNFPFCVGRVCHGSELPLEFYPPMIQKYYNVTKDEVKLSQEMQYYWTNFGRTGNPNSGNKPYLKWPQWDSNLMNMEFQTPNNIIVKGEKSQICDFWDSEGYHFGW